MTNEQASRFKISDEFTRSRPVSHETIQVDIAPSTIAEVFSKALVHECQRVRPLSFRDRPLDVDEVCTYIKYLFKMRCEQVNGNTVPWRKLKLLWVPDFVEYVLSLIGKVDFRDYGLKIMPVYKGEVNMTLEEAYQVSEKLADYMNKPLHLTQNAFSTSEMGDEEVMSCALIADTVHGMRSDCHPNATYMAAFANIQLVKECAFSALYRVKYDDMAIIMDNYWSARERIV